MSQSPHRVRAPESLYDRGTRSFCWDPGSWLTQKVDTFDLSASSCPAANLSLIRSLGWALSKHSKQRQQGVWGISHRSTTGTVMKSAWNLAQKLYKESHTVPTSNLCPELCMQWSLPYTDTGQLNVLFTQMQFLNYGNIYLQTELLLLKNDSLSPCQFFNIIYEHLCHKHVSTNVNFILPILNE